ncbi:L,D-transpeptidase [Clostridium ganghwense]|uniref:L,D-transpeptidase n=1 Tax=Clostridium ganghwense TaxID=312089 RepID=A0ABT4CQB9_9CLOT|nr:L,D-transpeptidase [Clostridium ganghwense]MCY6370276.1 L,D-transpeptidase [Clostridium ganghwense]
MKRTSVRFAAITMVMSFFFTIACRTSIAYGAQSIPEVEKIVYEYKNVCEGDTQTIDILSRSSSKAQYRVWICNKKTGEWQDITKGFTSPVSENQILRVTTPKLTEGEYDVSIWVKRAGVAPLNKKGFDKYFLSKMKCLKSNEQEPTIKLDCIKDNYSKNEAIEVKNESSKELYKYNVYIYDILHSKTVKSYSTQYKDSFSWKSSSDGIYLFKIKLNSGEKIEEIYKLVIVGKPKRPTKKVQVTSKGPKAPKLDSLVVGNTSETNIIYVKQQPKSNSRTVGYIYGSLQGIKILKTVGNYYYVETTDYRTLNKITGYIPTWNVKTVKPNKSYSVLVDISDQHIYVFKDGKLIRNIVCSTGNDWTPTPQGTYLIGSRGPSFLTGTNKSIICYNWVRFNNNFLFHSVLCTKNGQPISSAVAKLGHKASHGCIRMPLEESKWFYNNVPRGSLLVIQQ